MWRIVAPLALAALLSGTAALAADGYDTPVRALTVQAPGSHTVHLDVRDVDGGGVCLDLEVDGETRADAICPAPPTTVAGDLAPRVLSEADFTLFYGATTRRTRRVDLLVSSGKRLRARTIDPVAHPGRTRFYAVAVRGAPVVASVVVRDAAGRAREARDLNPFALPAVGRRAAVLSLRDETRRRVTLIALAARILRPTAAAPTRRKLALCTGLRLRGTSVAGRTLCVVKPNLFDVRFTANCTDRRELLYGIGPPSIRRAVAVLAGGKRVRVPLRRVPAGVKRPGIVLAGIVEGSLARRVIGYGADGTELVSARLSGGQC